MPAFDSFTAPPEYRLFLTWRTMLEWLQCDSFVSAKTIHRITVGVEDCITCCSMVRELFAIHDAETASHLRLMSEVVLGPVRFDEGANERSVELARNIPSAQVTAARLTVATKALHFFFRGLQDGAYRALVECDGNLREESKGSGASMSKVLKSVKSPIKILLDRECPGYTEWFSELKGKRDHMKYGSRGGAGWSFDKGISLNFDQMRLDEGVARGDRKTLKLPFA